MRGKGIAKRKYPIQRLLSPLRIMCSGMNRYIRVHQNPIPPPMQYAIRRSLFLKNSTKFLITFLSSFFCMRSSFIFSALKMEKASKRNSVDNKNMELIPNLFATNPAISGPTTYAMLMKVNMRPSFLMSFPFFDLSLIIRPKLVIFRVVAIVKTIAIMMNNLNDSTKNSPMYDPAKMSNELT